MNAAAKVYRTQNSIIDMDHILNVGGFDLDLTAGRQTIRTTGEHPFFRDGEWSFTLPLTFLPPSEFVAAILIPAMLGGVRASGGRQSPERRDVSATWSAQGTDVPRSPGAWAVQRLVGSHARR